MEVHYEVSNMKGDEAPAWELYKENAAPLERGRNVTQLSKSLVNMTSNENMQYKEERKRRFESVVEGENGNDNPLITWLEYIKFMQENYPSDTQATFLIMERCTRTLLSNERYHQDTRFIRVCILYADRTTSPSDIYRYLHQRRVGTQTALFWVAWAWVTEKANDFTFADKVFSKGMKKGATPLKLLETRYKQFQRRMSRHWLNQQQTQSMMEEGDGGDGSVTGRGTLTALTQDGAQSNQRARADNVDFYVDENTGRRIPITNRRQPNNIGAVTGTLGRAPTSSHSASRSSRPDNKNANNSGGGGGGGFKIFTDTASSLNSQSAFLNDSIMTHADDQSNSSTNNNCRKSKVRHQHSLAKQAEVTKENTMRAERWNERGGLKPATAMKPQHQPAPPAFQVFVDEHCPEQNTHNETSSLTKKKSNNNNVLSLRQRSEEGIADKLKNDPLRYVRNPDKFARDQKNNYNSSHAAPKNEQTTAKKRDSKKKEATSSNHQNGFSTRLLVNDHGQETCFEECRATRKLFHLQLSNENINLLKVETTYDYIEENSIMSISMEDVSDNDDSDHDNTGKYHENSFITKKDQSFEGGDNLSRNCSHYNEITQATINKQCTQKSTSFNINTSICSTSSVGTIDPTINTKLALRELSTMFSSPVQHVSFMNEPQEMSMLKQESPPMKRYFEPSYNDNSRTIVKKDMSSFSIMEDFVNDDQQHNHHQMDNSILAASRKEGVIQTQIQKRSKTVAFSSSNENDAPMIYVDENNTTNHNKVKKKPLGISLSSSTFPSKNNDTSAIPFQPFEIHQEDNSHHLDQSSYYSDQAEESKDDIKLTSPPFSIYNEGDEGNYDEIEANDSNGSTFMKIGEPMKGLNVKSSQNEDKEALNIYEDNHNNTSSSLLPPQQRFNQTTQKKQNESKFEIFYDGNENNMNHNKSAAFNISTDGKEDKEITKSAPFEIFTDENNHKCANQNSVAPFEIFTDENDESSANQKSAPFEIFTDENDESSAVQGRSSENKFKSFEIHTDACDGGLKKKLHTVDDMENGDTATFSLFNEAFNEVDKNSPMKKREEVIDNDGYDENTLAKETNLRVKRDFCITSKQFDASVKASNVSQLPQDKAIQNSKNEGGPSISYLLRKRLNKDKENQSSAPFEIFTDENSETNALCDIKKKKCASFQIHMEGVDNDDKDESHTDGDTATFSLFNEALQGLDESTIVKENRAGAPIVEKKNNFIEKQLRSTRRSGRLLSKPQRDFKSFSEGLDTTYERDNKNVMKRSIHKFKKSITEVSALHDISHIDIDDSIENDQPNLYADDNAIDFDTLHKKESRWALDQTMKDAAKQCELEASASVETLEWNDKTQLDTCLVDDRRSKKLPKGLTRKNPAKHTTVELGGLVKSSAVVMHELGRGGYGVVLLCDALDAKDRDHSLALKVQTPTGALAWEYNVLTKLDERLPHQNRVHHHNSSKHDSIYNAKKKCNTSQFPRALSFTVFSDGALLAMTAASATGITLVDVVNCHKKAGVGPVPELLAMHYTVKMLLLIENMHWHGKILHCDVKPDNWVLTPLKVQSGEKEDYVIEGGDLMLVDFGRSIDLQRVSEETKEQPFNIRFTGNIAAKDFECVAMREGNSWGTDADTYGLCATAHALLYGSYLNVEKNHVSGRWFPQKTLRRYWNKNLWTNLFDTLLNAEGKYSNNGSHPDSLRSIRKSFEEYLDHGNRRNEIRTLLRHQIDYFPTVISKDVVNK